MSNRAMTKMEACRHLCELKDHLLKDNEYCLKQSQDAAKEVLPRPSSSYYEDRIVQNNLQSRALEMAGAALTR